MKKVLLLAFGFPVQYRALRCAAAGGRRVYILGDHGAQLLRYSRYCTHFGLLSPAASTGSDAALDRLRSEIDEYAAAYNLDIAVAGDGRSTRLLSLLRDQLSIPTFPVPTTEVFDVLDDKWNFNRLCRRLEVPVPQSWLFETKADLLVAFEAQQLPPQFIAKPLRLFGEAGFVKFDRGNGPSRIRQLDYSPILVQEYIDGRDVCLSVFACRGKVIASVSYYKTGQTYVLTKHDLYLSYGKKIADHFHADGLLNFDARITSDGRTYLLECNPRVYLSMDYALIAGMNFIDIGLRNWENYEGELLTCEDRIRRLKGTLKLLLKPWEIRHSDLRMAGYTLGDPVPQLIEAARLMVLRSQGSLKQKLSNLALVQRLVS